MSAFVHRAGQHKFSRRHGLVFFRSIALVESEQNGHAALLAANAEIPPCVGFGPSRNIHRASLPSEMPAVFAVARRNGLTPICFIIRSIKRCDTDETPLDPASILIPACIRRNNVQFSMHKDSSWKYSTATRKTVQE